MSMRIALAGNPNSGKTTLFNRLTGTRQTTGNWPGVTVEKKTGHIRHTDGEMTVIDLPGIYSLSPYSLEETISRNYIVDESPDVVVNIIDATNLERNLYLTRRLEHDGRNPKSRRQTGYRPPGSASPGSGGSDLGKKRRRSGRTDRHDLRGRVAGMPAAVRPQAPPSGPLWLCLQPIRQAR